jgi:hypothetical protein
MSREKKGMYPVKTGPICLIVAVFSQAGISVNGWGKGGNCGFIKKRLEKN